MSDTDATPAPAENGPRVPDWVRRHYLLVDAAELDRYIEDFAEDAELRFGSAPPVRGRAAIREALAAGHARHAMRHAYVNVWEQGDITIIEFEVQYTLPGDQIVTLPSLAIVRRTRDRLIDQLRVYIDQGPLRPDRG
jgi:ketosteroid isomerase-like protein